MKKTKDNKLIFNSYLAGLFEGNGQIWYTKEKTKNIQNPRFCITFNLKNEFLAKKLLKIIGYGFLIYKSEKKTCVLIISSIKGLKKVIESINGELRTSKIIQLHNLINWINKNHTNNIVKLSLKKGKLDGDSWLSGFIDANGSFFIQHTKIKNNTKKRKISCKLRIEQIMHDPMINTSYYNILTEIAKFFSCNLNTRKQVSTNKEYFNLIASNYKSLLTIKNYLNYFPLYSYKYLDYKDWEKAAVIILKKNQYTEQGIIIIDTLKNNMNSKRTYFNWDHLNNLH
jgi:LAGLIDADG endonuclease